MFIYSFEKTCNCLNTSKRHNGSTIFPTRSILPLTNKGWLVIFWLVISSLNSCTLMLFFSCLLITSCKSNVSGIMFSRFWIISFLSFVFCLFFLSIVQKFDSLQNFLSLYLVSKAWIDLFEISMFSSVWWI